jgi:hypothetical protein
MNKGSVIFRTVIIKDQGEKNVFYCYKAAERKLYEELINRVYARSFTVGLKMNFGELQ